MDDFSRHSGWWGYHRAPPEPLSITQLIAAGSLDAELAALLWLLVEGRVPVLVVAAAPRAGKTTTLSALLDFLPGGTRRVFLRGWEEDFAWLPDARSLGWLDARADAAPSAAGRTETASAAPDDEPADPATSHLMISELSSHLPAYTWGLQARVAVRALQRGYGMAATMHADSLEDVFRGLTAPPVGLTEDEIRRLGVVIVLRLIDGSRRRAAAVHYLRPLERDGHGHLQRRPPGVLATWEPNADRFEHFAWGLTPELADRIGTTQARFERAQADRAAFLGSLVRSGVMELPAVRRALERYRSAHDLAYDRAPRPH
jgi:hypothetical protein